MELFHLRRIFRSSLSLIAYMKSFFVVVYHRCPYCITALLGELDLFIQYRDLQ